MKRALVWGFVMSSLTACAHAGARTDVVRHYRPSTPAPLEAVLADGQPHARLRELAPHFVRQQTDSACSVASIATVLGAVRARQGRPSVSQAQLLASDATGRWARDTRAGVGDDVGDGVDLDTLALFALQAFHALATPAVGIDVVHVPTGAPSAAEKLIHVLEAGERGQGGFVVTNALQSRLLADGDPVGHMSVVGGWDAARRRVLILDVDPFVPAPYWVPIDVLVAAMQTRDDVTGEPRGYLVVRTD